MRQTSLLDEVVNHLLAAAFFLFNYFETGSLMCSGKSVNGVLDEVVLSYHADALSVSILTLCAFA